LILMRKSVSAYIRWMLHSVRPDCDPLLTAGAAALKREIEAPLVSYGSLQGILHAWFKEAREPYFQMRELSTDALVRVYYHPALYSDVAKAVQERTTMLMVSGNLPTFVFTISMKQQASI
jgi:hypothetical protein